MLKSSIGATTRRAARRVTGKLLMTARLVHVVVGVVVGV
jgi:hypothetical protein